MVILCYITSSGSALDTRSPISKKGGGVTGCACLVDESSHEELVHLISCFKIFLLFVYCVMYVCAYMSICWCLRAESRKGHQILWSWRCVYFLDTWLISRVLGSEFLVLMIVQQEFLAAESPLLPTELSLIWS